MNNIQQIHNKQFSMQLIIFMCLLLYPDLNLKSQTVTDKDLIAYCLWPSTGNSSIYTINFDGSDNKLLMSAGISLNHPEYSPDGKKVACVGYINMETTWSIYVFNSDGTNLIRLTKTPNVFDGALSWSPDGSTIAFTRSFPSQPSRGDEVWLMNADGSNQHYSGIKGFQPMWSHDGNKFVYSSGKSGNYEIYVSNFDGSNETRLTTNTADDSNPVWSKDGSQIAFSSDRDGDLEIYIMNSDGSQLKQITNNNVLDNMPRWSPDGSTIAFNSNLAGDQHTSVYLINADGTNVRCLINTSGNAMSINPVWKPVIQSTYIKEHLNVVPRQFELFQNYPNPFNPDTKISFELKSTSLVKLEVYDLLGRQIKLLLNEELGTGIHNFIWNGNDNSGVPVSSGVYLISLSNSLYIKLRKTALIK